MSFVRVFFLCARIVVRIVFWFTRIYAASVFPEIVGVAFEMAGSLIFVVSRFDFSPCIVVEIVFLIVRGFPVPDSVFISECCTVVRSCFYALVIFCPFRFFTEAVAYCFVCLLA